MLMSQKILGPDVFRRALKTRKNNIAVVIYENDARILPYTRVRTRGTRFNKLRARKHVTRVSATLRRLLCTVRDNRTQAIR